MNKVKVSSIRSLLSTPCTLQDNHNRPILLNPGEQITSVSDMDLSVVPNVNAIDATNFRCLDVEGDPHMNAFALVAKQGLISALGTDTTHFSPDDPALIKVSIPEGYESQSISLTIMEDEEANGRVVWVVGDIDDAI